MYRSDLATELAPLSAPHPASRPGGHELCAQAGEQCRYPGCTEQARASRFCSEYHEELLFDLKLAADDGRWDGDA